MRYVLDCSVALKWFFQEPLSDRAIVLLARVQEGEAQLVAPDCIVPELGHALYLALAERENLKVLTADDRMANAFASLNRTLRLSSFE